MPENSNTPTRIAKKPLRRNIANKISYFSDAYPGETNFAFCQVYQLDVGKEGGHGFWTTDLDILYSLYIEKYQLMEGVDKLVYDYSKSLANRRQGLSAKALGKYAGVGELRIIQALDRLQDLRLGHRVCRLDTHGTAHDFVLHTPFHRMLNEKYNPKDPKSLEPMYKEELWSLQLEELLERVNTGPTDKHTKRFGKECNVGFTKSRRLDRRGDEPRRTRSLCCDPGVTYDLREIRMYFHKGIGPDDNGGKIPRRYWKPDPITNRFLTYVLDALKKMFDGGHRPHPYENASELRTQNWKIFQGHLKTFCQGRYDDTDGRTVIHMNNHRWIAARRLGNFYAPNMFDFVEI